MANLSQPIPASQNPPTEIPAEGMGDPIVKKAKKRRPLIRRYLSNLRGRETAILRQLTDKKLDPLKAKMLNSRLSKAQHRYKVISKLHSEGVKFDDYYKQFNDVPVL